jgi:hypothetical protein
LPIWPTNCGSPAPISVMGRLRWEQRWIAVIKEASCCSGTYPDHPWVDSADGAAVRIAMTVASRGEEPGRLSEVSSESQAVDEHIPVTVSARYGLLSADLRIGASTSIAVPLRANAGLANRGFCLFGAGFVVSPEKAEQLGLGTTKGLDQHIRPYRNGKYLTQCPRRVMVVDLFELSENDVRDLYPACYQHVATTVKPERDHNKRESRRRLWWVFGEPNKQLVSATLFL